MLRITFDRLAKRYFPYLTRGGFLVDDYGQYLVDVEGRRIEG